MTAGLPFPYHEQVPDDKDYLLAAVLENPFPPLFRPAVPECGCEKKIDELIAAVNAMRAEIGKMR
jgi:hypothetical protein